MLNILVALHIFGEFWHGHRIGVKCDNLAVVQVLQTGKTRDPFLGACARNIWMESAKTDIDLMYSHIQGSKNMVADLLSRWKNFQVEQMLCESVKNPISMAIPEKVLQIDNEI